MAEEDVRTTARLDRDAVLGVLDEMLDDCRVEGVSGYYRAALLVAHKRLSALAAVDALETSPRAEIETIEYGRELQDGFVVPWSYRSGGQPDLAKFPPGMNGEPTTWVQREITKWRPVAAEVVESSPLTPKDGK